MFSRYVEKNCFFRHIPSIGSFREHMPDLPFSPTSRAAVIACHDLARILRGNHSLTRAAMNERNKKRAGFKPALARSKLFAPFAFRSP
jgi:hypothetical protein